MQSTFRRGSLANRPVGALVSGIVQGERRLTGAAAELDRATRGALRALLATGDFDGRPLQVAVIHPRGIKAKRVIVVGLGRAAELTPARLRAASAVGVRRARELAARTVAVAIPLATGALDPAIAAQATAEGVVLGHHRFTAYKTRNEDPALARAELLGAADADDTLAAAAERGVRWAEATCLARDLAMTPGSDLVPATLAERARDVARATGARITVLGVPQLERLGANALLAVGKGSPHPPRLIVLESSPKAKTAKPKTIVIVGKGITFDTGGISIKPREGMEKMKYDMAGAAAVIGLFAALPTLELPFRVVGVIASAENMPDGAAFKPGDVLRTLDGTTVEVTNTDAEGRLVLADALGYARRFKPEAVVDLATLTGAISIALGPLAAGLFSEDDALADELIAAARATGDGLWRMPVSEDYAAFLRSDTADFVNSGAREGGASIAASFLRHFARGMRWAHLDIASTGWAGTDRPLERRGPTGYGVRLLLEWLSRRAARPA
jgi:leucyl aminopeptidase